MEMGQMRVDKIHKQCPNCGYVVNVMWFESPGMIDMCPAIRRKICPDCHQIPLSDFLTIIWDSEHLTPLNGLMWSR